MKNMKGQDDYVTIRIPRELADEIDKIVKHGTLGYRTRAELVNDAIRLRIELLRFNNSMKFNALEKSE
jgi:metal-responsive CopG/Arc/MetJ family transcriptional regulator